MSGSLQSEMSVCVWQVTSALGKCSFGGVLKALGMALWVRFQKICMSRTKSAATAAVRKAKEKAFKEHGDKSAAVLMINHHGKGLRKGALNQYKERYFLLRTGILRWYNLDHLVEVDEDDAYDFEKSPVLGTVTLGAHHTLTKVDSAKESHFHMVFGDGYGIVLQDDNSLASERIMFHHEETRDEWYQNVELVIRAIQESKTLEEGPGKGGKADDSSSSGLQISEQGKQDSEDPHVHLLRDKTARSGSWSILVQQEVDRVDISHKLTTSFVGGSGGMGDQRVDVEHLIFGSKEGRKGDDLADGGILQSNLLPSQCSVEIEIFFRPGEIDTTGLAESVAQGVAEDVASAVNGYSDKIWAQEYVPGSGVVHMVLLEGVCGDSRLPVWVVHDIERQMQDSSSRLRQGAFSSKILAFRVVTEVLHDDISFEKLEPIDRSSQMDASDMREFSCTPLPQAFGLDARLGYLENGQDNVLDNLPPLLRVTAPSVDSSALSPSSSNSLPPLIPTAMLAPSPVEDAARLWKI